MINLQDAMLNSLRKERIPVTVFLVNGFQIRGTVKAFDSFTVLMEADGRQEIVYKHALSTLIPQRAVEINNISLTDEINETKLVGREVNSLG